MSWTRTHWKLCEANFWIRCSPSSGLHIIKASNIEEYATSLASTITHRFWCNVYLCVMSLYEYLCGKSGRLGDILKQMSYIIYSIRCWTKILGVHLAAEKWGESKRKQLTIVFIFMTNNAIILIHQNTPAKVRDQTTVTKASIQKSPFK